MHSTISEYIIKAREGDARRAGERDRLLLEVRRARMTMRRRPSLAVRVAHLVARWARAIRRQTLGAGAQSTGSSSHTPARITVRPENSAGPFHT
jgi:hypothetical protein